MMGVSSRRSLFAGAGAVIIGSGITAGVAASVADLVPPSADAQLVAIGTEAKSLGAEYYRMLQKWWALPYPTVQDPELEQCAAEMDGPHNRLCELSGQAMELRATTPEGWQAKAALVRHFMVVEYETEGRMEFSSSDQELICDMTGGRA